MNALELTYYVPKELNVSISVLRMNVSVEQDQLLNDFLVTGKIKINVNINV